MRTEPQEDQAALGASFRMEEAEAVDRQGLEGEVEGDPLHLVAEAEVVGRPS